MAQPIEWRNVFSKSVTRIGYDFDTTSLLAEWQPKKNSPLPGRISAYGPDFPYDEFVKGSKIISVGNWIKDEVKPKYEHRYVT